MGGNKIEKKHATSWGGFPVFAAQLLKPKPNGYSVGVEQGGKSRKDKRDFTGREKNAAVEVSSMRWSKKEK